MKTYATRGLVAGFVAATTFAGWFLLVDIIKGQPLATPAYMSGLVFSFTTALPATARLLVFTLLHFIAFGAVGVLVAMLMERAHLHPGLYLGAVLGFLLFDIVFYGSVVLLGVNVVRALGWPQVLTANIVAGIALFGYLRLSAGLPLLGRREDFERHVRVRRGLITGLIGAGVVALWFMVLDIVQGQLFYTPAALGSALFFGASQPGDVVTSAAVVLGYSLVHVTGFVLVGLGLEWLVNEAEKHAVALFAAVLLIVTFEVGAIGILSLVGSWLFQTMAWWPPVVANILAGIAMIAYLWRAHPGIHARLSEPIEEEVSRGVV